MKRNLILASVLMLSGCLNSFDAVNENIKYIAVYADIWNATENTIILGYNQDFHEIAKVEEPPISAYYIAHTSDQNYLMGGNYLYLIDPVQLALSKEGQYSGPVESVTSINNQVYYLAYEASMDANIMESGIRNSEGRLIYESSGATQSLTSHDGCLYLLETSLQGESKVLQLTIDGDVVSTVTSDKTLFQIMEFNNSVVGVSEVGYYDIYNSTIIGEPFPSACMVYYVNDKISLRSSGVIDYFTNSGLRSIKLQLPDGYQPSPVFTVAQDSVVWHVLKDGFQKFFEVNIATGELTLLDLPDQSSILKLQLVGVSRINGSEYSKP